MYNLINPISLLLSVSLLLAACGNKPDPDTEPDPDPGLAVCGSLTELTDDRDGQVYQVVKIGTQCWMAENLNYETPNSFCFDDKTLNCDSYGRLYKWEDAENACPAGWHLPSNAEWVRLTDELGGVEIAGGKLKTEGTTTWQTPNEGATNETGFNGLPSGSRGSGGAYDNLGTQCYFWTSTSAPSNDAFATYRGLSYVNAEVGDYRGDKRFSFAIRCVRN